ncbi:MAG: hypothetical protein ACFB16_19225 [Phormidesmis sp.]
MKELVSSVSTKLASTKLGNSLGVPNLVRSWRSQPIETTQLIYLVGLKRSGLHALSFWLLGHGDRNLLVNNSPVKRPGSSSPMSRTVRTSPLPVSVRQGDEVAVCQSGQEILAPAPAAVDLSVVLFQSQSLPYLARQSLTATGLTEGIHAQTAQPVLTLRDPFNWAASYMKKSQSADDYRVWPTLWKEYANEFVGKTQYFPGAVRVNYNRWFCDCSYRRHISTQLNLDFTDKTLEVVTAHAGGSSFDRTQFDANAQQMAVTERWRRFEHKPQYIEAFRSHPDIVELALSIFDLPPDLAAFARSCYASV